MALSETIEYDKIEIVGPYKYVQVRKSTIVTKDSVEIARSFSRFWPSGLENNLEKNEDYVSRFFSRLLCQNLEKLKMFSRRA